MTIKEAKSIIATMLFNAYDHSKTKATTELGNRQDEAIQLLLSTIDKQEKEIADMVRANTALLNQIEMWLKVEG